MESLSTIALLKDPARVVVDLTADLATGGAGNDTLANIQVVIGSTFNDTFSTGISGSDTTLLGGAGNDHLKANNNANNLLKGELGIDTLIADFTDGNNTLDGGDGNDRLSAAQSYGNNSLIGGVGDDQLDVGGSIPLLHI